ncbi:MAG: hypothetical protein WC445_01155 [Patescibacteria group bacterium]
MYQKSTLYNKTLTLADTEYSQALPTDTRKVLISERSGGADLKLAYVSGESGTKFITIRAGSSKYLEGVYLSGVTLYMQSPTAGAVIEIEVWQDQ